MRLAGRFQLGLPLIPNHRMDSGVRQLGSLFTGQIGVNLLVAGKPCGLREALWSLAQALFPQLRTFARRFATLEQSRQPSPCVTREPGSDTMAVDTEQRSDVQPGRRVPALEEIQGVEPLFCPTIVLVGERVFELFNRFANLRTLRFHRRRSR